MEKLKILIVEDDLIIAESLKVILEEDMGYEVPAIFISGRQTLEKFRPGFADIIIMDIQLADNTNGIDTSIEIRKVSSAPIIYVTDNMDEYLRKKAIFETNTVQYITKPFTQLDISVAMDLAIKTIKGHSLALQNGDCTSHLNNECIFVKENQGFRKIMIGDILFIKADRAYSELVFRNNSMNKNETIIFSENLSILEEKLLFAKELIRVNRSYIINSNFIKKTRENALWIEDVEIPIGKTYRNAIRDRFRFI